MFSLKERIQKRMRFILIGCVSMFAVSSCSTAQKGYPNVEIPISNLNYTYAGCEPSIAINPTNKKEMSAGSILNGYHYSRDGGHTWKTKNLQSPFGVYGDPVLVYNHIGELFYFHLSDFKETSWLDRIVCQKKQNIESDFSEGSYTQPNGSKVQDKHWITVSPENNHMYMTWTQFDKYDSSDKNDSSFILFSKSLDRGITWTIPKRISFYGGDCLDGDNTVEGAVPAIGKNGTLVVTWTGPKGIMMQRSEDEGETWMRREEKIIDHPEGWDIAIPGMNRANGLPFLVSDLSNGPRNGTLYLNWADQRNGTNDTDIWLMVSKDNGAHWEGPKRVNQDSTKTHQFFTNLSVDQTNGNLHFVFYDRSRFNNDAHQTEVSWVQSKDGGATFESRIISDHSFIPIESVFFGDYLDIDAHDNSIRPIWPSYEKGKIRLWTAIIDENK